LRPPFKTLCAFVADEQSPVICTAFDWTDLFTAIAGIRDLPMLGRHNLKPSTAANIQRIIFLH
jgi:hypothetical protein